MLGWGAWNEYSLTSLVDFLVGILGFLLPVEILACHLSESENDNKQTIVFSLPSDFFRFIVQEMFMSDQR